MKKVAIVLLAATLLATKTKAQFFEKGTNVISAGVGLGGHYGSYSYASQTPSLSLQYEKGIWDIPGPGVISLGGYAGIKGYKNSSSSGSYHYTEKWNYTVIGVRSAYHYNGINIEKLDVYGGVMLSYNILSYKYTDNSGGSSTYRGGSYGSTLGFSAYAGGRYLFTEQLAAFAELGFGVSYLTLGLAYKF
jgi:hypothetical protein